MLQGEPFLDIKCLHLNKLEYNSEMKIKKKKRPFIRQGKFCSRVAFIYIEHSNKHTLCYSLL